MVAINQIFPPLRLQRYCFFVSSQAKCRFYFSKTSFLPYRIPFCFVKTASCNHLITRKPNSKSNAFCHSAQACSIMKKNNNSSLCFGDYLTTEPFFKSLSGETKLKLPSRFSAIKIIPLLSMPFKFFGARLTSTDTCLPIISSGL